MPRTIFFTEDVANVLRSVALANRDTGAERNAFMRALVAVGFAFGLQPEESIGSVTQFAPLKPDDKRGR